jgi:hypothetical protein
MTAILDRLPAPARHAILVFLGSSLTVIFGAISSAHGVTGIDWVTVLSDSLNAGVVAAVAAVGIAAATPLTTQYGVGSPKVITTPPDGSAQDLLQ